MVMRKHYDHTLLYLQETISLGSGRSDSFTDTFSELYHPMMAELGARLFSIWEATPYNGHWPQVTIMWEIEPAASTTRRRPFAQSRRTPEPQTPKSALPPATASETSISGPPSRMVTLSPIVVFWTTEYERMRQSEPIWVAPRS